MFIFFKINISSQNFFNDFQNVSNAQFIDSNLIKINKATYIFSGKSNFVKYNPISLIFGGSLFFYQRVISKQIMMGCAFNPSCSNFSKQSIKMYGLFKGIALSADRLTRCTKLSSIDFHPVLFDENGKYNDFPINYTLKEK